VNQVVPFNESANKLNFSFEFRRYFLAFRQPIRTSAGAWPSREGIYVRIGRPDGTFGFGEAAPVPAFGRESVDDLERACRTLGERVGADVVSQVPKELGTLRHALSDAMGGSTGAPRQESLGVAALLPAGRAALAEVSAKAEAGYRVFKCKVGVGSARDEMAILDDLLGALPGTSSLRLDANGGWDRKIAGKWLDYSSERPVEYVEQPLAPDLRGLEDSMFGLAADYRVPIALDESIASDADAARWLERGWKGFFIVKPSLMGDAAGTLERLATAEARVVFSSALETGLGARSALRHAFAWKGNGAALGFGVWPLFSDAAFDGPSAAPFVRMADVDRISPEALWSAAS
jgi:O-succinylbenzoate synthase